jgi:CysZ protein
VGFGACVFLVFLIPLGAVFIMPAAVAGGTLLAREALETDAARPSLAARPG